MRSRLLLHFLILGIMLSTAVLYAAEADSPIPVYPGSKVEFELNLTQKDFLPVIRQYISLVPGVLAGFIAGGEEPAGANPMAALASQDVINQVQAALAGLNLVSVVAYKPPKEVSAEKVVDLYVKELGLSKGWLTTLRVDQDQGTVRLYVKPELTAMFGVMVDADQVAAFRTDGKIDLVAIGKLAAKYAPLIASHVGMSSSGPEGGITVPQKAGWEVVLQDVGSQKVRVLAKIREITEMTPSQAREFVQSLPQTLTCGLSEEEANQIKADLEAIGATVEVNKIE